MVRNGISSMWKSLAVITGLAAAAFVAPVLDIYGKNPEVFVANRTSATELFVFALVICFAITCVSFGILFVTGRISDRARDFAYRTIIGFLSLATGFVVSRQVVPATTWLAIVVGLFIAAAVYWISTVIDSVFAFAAIAVPVVLVMFVATSATASLIWEEPQPIQAGVEVDTPKHLVMLQLDEMPLASIVRPDGTINDDLFPGFAKLGESGTWYRDALSDSIATTQSVPAILTGKIGEKGLSPSYVDHPDNLFTLLEGSHEMHVIEWVAELCPEETCPDYAGRAPARFGNLLADVGVVYGHLTLPGAVRDGLPSIGNAWKGFLGQSDKVDGDSVEIEGLPVPDKRPDWIDWVQRLTNGIKDGTPPTLSYAHLRTPHVPWEANPSGTQYERPEEYTEVFGVEGDGRWSLDPAASTIGFQRHLQQVGFLDTMLLRLLNHIEQSGTWDDTMIVVVADHGASFTPGEHRRWPYDNNRVDLYRVPLFVKYPGQIEGMVVDTPVFGIDIVPTIVDVMGIDTDWSFDGESMLTIERDRPHMPLRWCCNGEGVDTDLGSLFDQVAANYKRIPNQTSWTGVMAVGEYADLVGSAIANLDFGGGPGFSFSVDIGTSLDDIDISSGELQTLITGRVAGDVPDELLIVANGIVAGVAHVSHDAADGGSFIGLMGEDWLIDGSNEVTLLALGDERLWVEGNRGDLDLVLRAPDGHTIEIGVEGGLRVQVDKVERVEGGYSLTGWGADTKNKVPPEIIYVFAGDVLVASGEPNLDNRNVVSWFDSDDLLRSGFEIEVLATDLPTGVDRVLVVAEYDGRAVADSVGLSFVTAEG